MILSKNNSADVYDWYENIDSTGGFVLIDNETDWTSFDVVAKLRGILKIKKIGHAGTLDPLATGLLIVGCGKKATRQLESFQALGKQYEATIKLGATTKTDDSEAEEENLTSANHLGENEIKETIQSFIGNIEQTPPIYSAIKVKGQRLYKLARSNKTTDIPVRTVTISDIKINRIELPYIDIVIDCSKGTYIRSLARDIGSKLQVGGYLYSLRRTAIGNETADNAFKIKEFEIIFKERNKSAENESL